MRQCIALNGSYFNTQRMIHQYVVKAYFAGGWHARFPAGMLISQAIMSAYETDMPPIVKAYFA